MIWKKTIKFFLIITLSYLPIMIGYFLITTIPDYSGLCMAGDMFTNSYKVSCSLYQYLYDSWWWFMIEFVIIGMFWLAVSFIATIFYWFALTNKQSAKKHPTTHHFHLFTLVGIISGFMLIVISLAYDFPNFSLFTPEVIFYVVLVIIPTALGSYYDSLKNKQSAESKTPTI